MSSMETIVTVVTALGFLAFGAVLISEGVSFYQMKKSNPTLPNKLYVAAWLSILCGIIEIFIGIFLILVLSGTIPALRII
jgi:phosphatidylserine synthase